MSKTSHFGELIYEFAHHQNISIRQLSDTVEGTTPSTFSKIRGGNYSKLTEERLNGILDALAPDDSNSRALLVCAYLWDMCPAAYHTSISIEPRMDSQQPPNQLSGKDFKINNLSNLLSDIGEAAAASPAFYEHILSLSKLAKLCQNSS